MTIRLGRRLALSCWACAVATACAAPAAAPPPAATATVAEVRASMGGIVSALAIALPAAEDADRFADPALHGELAAALAGLRGNASALTTHGSEPTPAFQFFSQRLAADAAEVEQRFAHHSYSEAAFLLRELTNDCVGCHVRLPDLAPHPAGEPLARAAEGMAPAARLRVLIAARQFEPALATCEALLVSPEWSPARLDLEGVLETYLVVAIRVRGDLARAERGLASLAVRPSMPTYLTELVGGWRRGLVDLAPLAQTPTVAVAKDVLLRGDAVRRYPVDRAGLVHDLVASSILHRALAAGIPAPLESAEASYLLGTAELRSDVGRELPQAEWYLESAIRQAPGSDVARDAYALLEEQAFLDWGGSAGIDLPADVTARLRELRGLAEQGE